MCDFDFNVFMIHLHDTDPFLFGVVLGCIMVAPLPFFRFSCEPCF